MRKHLTYANVMVTLLAIGALTGGVAYAANTIFSEDIVNGEVKSPDIANNQVRSVDVRNDNLSGGGLNAADIQNAPSGSDDVNADRLDGLDSTGFGQVRDFKFSINTVSNRTELLSFRGLTLSRSSEVVGGTLRCRVWVSSNADGRWDGAVIGGQPTQTLTGGGFTPVADDQFGNIASTDSRGLFEIVFINDETGHVLTVNYSIYGYPENGGCRWQGTAYAPG